MNTPQNTQLSVRLLWELLGEPAHYGARYVARRFTQRLEVLTYLLTLREPQNLEIKSKKKTQDQEFYAN